jgi:hypothetical protein
VLLDDLSHRLRAVLTEDVPHLRLLLPEHPRRLRVKLVAHVEAAFVDGRNRVAHIVIDHDL